MEGFPQTPLDKRRERGNGGNGAGRAHHNPVMQAHVKRHNAHEAFDIGGFAVFTKDDAGGKALGRVNQQGRRACVKPCGIHYRERLWQQCVALYSACDAIALFTAGRGVIRHSAVLTVLRANRRRNREHGSFSGQDMTFHRIRHRLGAKYFRPRL